MLFRSDQDGARALRDTEQYLRQPGASVPTADDAPRPNGLDLETDTEGLRPLPRAHYDDDAASAISDDSMEITDVGGGGGGGGPLRHSTHGTALADDDDYDAGSTSTSDPTHPDPFSRAELKRYFWTEGNYRTLAGTALTWFLLDLAFYGLGINNPRTIARLWSSQRVDAVADLPSWANPADAGAGIYETLRLDGVRAIITDAAGSLVGSALLIKAINYVPRRAWLIWSFAGMGVLFAVIGGSYFKAVDTDLHALTITLYVLVQLLFNLGTISPFLTFPFSPFSQIPLSPPSRNPHPESRANTPQGPNTLTFILPAELFPTRYRATCHGISACFGKLGSIVVVSFLPSLNLNDPHSLRLGYLLIAFAPLMGIGALVAWAWIPEVQGPRGSGKVGPDGKGRWVVPSLSLEELEIGRAHV